jgi:uncharacterized coiled-coil DUF342 family protein
MTDNLPRDFRYWNEVIARHDDIHEGELLEDDPGIYQDLLNERDEAVERLEAAQRSAREMHIAADQFARERDELRDKFESAGVLLMRAQALLALAGTTRLGESYIDVGLPRLIRERDELRAELEEMRSECKAHGIELTEARAEIQRLQTELQRAAGDFQRLLVAVVGREGP